MDTTSDFCESATCLPMGDTPQLSDDEGSSCTSSVLPEQYEDQIDNDDCMSYSECEMVQTLGLLGGKRRKTHLQLYCSDTPLKDGLVEAASRGDMALVTTCIENHICIDFVNEFGNTALLVASYHGHLDVVRYLIECGADTNRCGNMSQLDQSVLHTAAMSGNCELVQYLVQNTSFINSVDGAKETPLHLAARKGHHIVVRVLLANGADVSILSILEQNCLYPALQRNHKTTIDEILQTDVDINASDIHGNSPLHKAKSNTVTRQLIQRGAALNCRNNKGETPLFSAARLLQLEKMKTLLNYGADPNAADDMDVSPLHQSTFVDMASALVSAGAQVNATDVDGKTPFHYAADIPDLDVLRYLWQCGANVNAQDLLGYTAIYKICWDNMEDNSSCIVKDLIKMGCDANITDHAGMTPVMLAATVAPPVVITTLVESGVDINHRDNYGRTTLVAAMEHPEEIRHLVELGASATIQDKAGYTFLHHCAAKNCVESAKCVANQNTQLLEMKDSHMATALHVASATSSSPDMVKYLIDSGLGVNDRDKFGCTPLHYAAYSGCKSSFVFLLNAGADINMTDNRGETAITLVHRRRRHAIMSHIETFHVEFSPSACLSNCFTEEMTSFTVDNINRVCLEQDKVIEMSSVELVGSADSDSRYISDVLNTYSVGAVKFEQGELKSIKDTFRLMAQNISAGISQKDNRFRCKVVPAGSAREDTKVGDPDEFDFMFVLEKFGRLCQPPRLEDRENVIFTSLRSSSKHANIPEAFRMFFKEGILLRSKVYNTFAYLLSSVITSKEFQWPSNVQPGSFWNKGGHDDSRQVTIWNEYLWRGQEFKWLKVSVDMVPSIHVTDWPSDVSSLLVTDRMISSGYHLVAKPFENTEVSPNAHIANLWRMSFAVVESMIFDDMDMELKNSYRIAKAMRHEEICPQILVAHDGVRDVIRCCNVIPSYFIKVCLFNLLLSGELRDITSDLVTKIGVVKLFKNLELAFSEKFLPYSLLPSYNLIKDSTCGDSKDIIISYCRVLRFLAST